MDAAGAITAGHWGLVTGPGSMQSGDRYNAGSSQSYGPGGADFAPQWAAASFASSMVSLYTRQSTRKPSSLHRTCSLPIIMHAVVVDCRIAVPHSLEGPVAVLCEVIGQPIKRLA